MTQHEWLLAGMVCLGVALGMVMAWLSTRRAGGFRKRLLDELTGVEQEEGGVEQRLREILGRPGLWKRSQSLVRKPFSKHVNLGIETAAMIYALVALVNSMVHFDKSFDSPAQAYGVMIFLSMIVGYIPSEHLISSRAEQEMDSVLEEMAEAVKLKRTDTFLDRARKEWQ